MKRYETLIKMCGECPCVYWIWDKPSCRFPLHARSDVTDLNTTRSIDEYYPNHMPEWCPLEDI
jgi:hypothetical protein